MAIKQVSEKLIRNTYHTLEEYTNKTLTHNESDLFYKDGEVYKIYKKMFRLYRQSYMWILDNKDFKNAINIESLLYQGDKLIGSTTKYYNDLTNMKEILKKEKIETTEIKTIYNILKELQEQLLQYNLCYIDPNLSNICLYKDQILIGDLDGVYYKPDKKIVEASYINFLKVVISLLIRENIFMYENWIQNRILNQLFGEKIYNFDNIVKNMTETQRDILNEKYMILKKDSFTYQSK